MRHVFCLATTLMLTNLPLLPQAVAAQDLPQPTAGTYTVDLSHTRLLFRVSHMGFSHYTAMFTKIDATLKFNPEAPESMILQASIDPASVETNFPDPALDFNAVIAGEQFLDAAKYPTITFASTDITLTGANTSTITGDLLLHGVTKTLTLTATYNGGYGNHPMDPGGARIGFSATGSLLRSDFGIAMGIPAPGTTLGVGDRVEIIIETEFQKAAP